MPNPYPLSHNCRYFKHQKQKHRYAKKFCFLRLWNNRGFCPWRDLIPVGETMLEKACLGACTQAGFN